MCRNAKRLLESNVGALEMVELNQGISNLAEFLMIKNNLLKLCTNMPEVNFHFYNELKVNGEVAELEINGDSDIRLVI